jgi:hypothetical protein
MAQTAEHLPLVVRVLVARMAAVAVALEAPVRPVATVVLEQFVSFGVQTEHHAHSHQQTQLICD